MNTVLFEKNEDAFAYAFLIDGVLYEYEKWLEDEQLNPGDIYLAKITRNMPSINACFADLGNSEAAFLPYKEMRGDAKCGDSVLVQIKRPAVGKKAPYITQDISFAGEYLMYLPNSNKDGVSRRIEDKRRDMLKFAKKIPREKGAFIMRSKILYADEQSVLDEAKKLTKQFEKVKNKAANMETLGLVKPAQDPLEIFLRDNKTKIDEFYSNDTSFAETYDLPAKHMACPMQYKNAGGQYEKALRRKIYLKSGADLIIDPCEAFTIIDVNSRASRRGEALSVNLEAAKEIARILRIRKTGGIILIDFIDMPQKEQYNKLLVFFEDALQHDRVKTEVLGFTKLGILEMTRKRAQSAAPQIERCPVCGAPKEEN
ncbi:MAG: ribonuclease E/G [Christensenellales bacterium]|jgi:ribonuclease G